MNHSTGGTDTSSFGPAVRLGASSCLLGQNVRATGGHSRDRFLVLNLGPWVEWVPVCPEVEMGMPTPRPTIRLVGTKEAPRLMTSDMTVDHTDEMQAWGETKLDALASARLDGYVFKKNSPSCGLFRVRVYAEGGMPVRDGRGYFASMLTERFPLLPVEEDGRLNDPRLRENFIERIFAHQRWRTLLERGADPAGLVDFHTTQKLTVLAHSPKAYRELGRIVAQAGRGDFDATIRSYGTLYMEALGAIATRGRHRNVLEHLMGFLKDDLDARDKEELLTLIRDYQAELVPLVVPLTLLKHHLARNDVPTWVHRQAYLDPYPRELMLRNHV